MELRARGERLVDRPVRQRNRDFSTHFLLLTVISQNIRRCKEYQVK
jgi:hypothetical protein